MERRLRQLPTTRPAQSRSSFSASASSSGRGQRLLCKIQLSPSGDSMSISRFPCNLKWYTPSASGLACFQPAADVMESTASCNNDIQFPPQLCCLHESCQSWTQHDTDDSTIRLLRFFCLSGCPICGMQNADCCSQSSLS